MASCARDRALALFVAEGGVPVFRLTVLDVKDTSEIQNVVELLVAFESARLCAGSDEADAHTTGVDYRPVQRDGASHKRG